MTASDTPPPLTDEELAHARRRQSDPLAQTSLIEARLLAEVDRLRAALATVSDEAGVQCREAAARTVRAEKERDAMAGKVREFLEDERVIARRLAEVNDQNEKMRLLGLCEARKTMREYLGDDAPTRRSCGAKAQFFADDLLYTIGCGKDHGHRDPHYSFTAERGWVDGGVPFRAALGETGGTER